MDPLEQLKDIHLPTAVASWPPAYGWWLLAFFGLTIIILCIWLGYQHIRTTRIKKQAIQALSKLCASQADWPSQLNQLLKRAALGYFPQALVASLHGQQWCDFLTQQLPQKHREQFQHQFNAWQQNLYADPSVIDFAAASRCSRLWLRHALPAKKTKPLSQKHAESNHV